MYEIFLYVDCVILVVLIGCYMFLLVCMVLCCWDVWYGFRKICILLFYFVVDCLVVVSGGYLGGDLGCLVVLVWVDVCVDKLGVMINVYNLV